MSVIIRVDVVPNRIEDIYLLLKQIGKRGETRETLLAYLNPPSLRADGEEITEPSTSDRTSGKAVLREAILLGIVEESKKDNQQEDVLHLAEPLQQKDMTLRSYLESMLLVPEHASSHGQVDFPTVMAWFLMQDSSQPLNFTMMPAKEIRDMFGEERFGLTNTARTQNFYYWARYLGFCSWIASKDGTSVLVNPAEFLERHLPALLNNRGEVLLREVMAALAQQYLFFDGGTLRNEVEDLIPDRHQLQPNELAPSTSLALRQLERKGVIRLTNAADAAKMTLLSWPQATQVSHIALTAKAVS